MAMVDLSDEDAVRRALLSAFGDIRVNCRYSARQHLATLGPKTAAARLLLSLEADSTDCDWVVFSELVAETAAASDGDAADAGWILALGVETRQFMSGKRPTERWWEMLEALGRVVPERMAAGIASTDLCSHWPPAVKTAIMTRSLAARSGRWPGRWPEAAQPPGWAGPQSPLVQEYYAAFPDATPPPALAAYYQKLGRPVYTMGTWEAVEAIVAIPGRAAAGAVAVAFAAPFAGGRRSLLTAELLAGVRPEDTLAISVSAAIGLPGDYDWPAKDIAEMLAKQFAADESRERVLVLPPVIV